ncbi:hypothetical protein [Leucobacter luti]|uniref:hypothetical protein n=1 Tax=Leucobacter luti TaxID=340320 RepID=UPI003D0681C4
MSEHPVGTRRELRATHGRTRRRRRLRALALSTSVVAGATLLGIGTAGGTYALLQTRAELRGASLTAGTAELRLNDAVSAELGPVVLSPAAPATQAVKVTNIGSVRLRLSGHTSAASSTGILPYVQARLTPVANAASCTAGLGTAPAPLSSFAAQNFAELAPGASRWACLEVALRPGTPADLAGQQVPFTLTISGVQHAG